MNDTTTPSAAGRDTRKGITTAERALKAGRLDTARRALVYVSSRFGILKALSARTGRPYTLKADRAQLEAVLRIARALQAQGEREQQRVRSLLAS